MSFTDCDTIDPRAVRAMRIAKGIATALAEAAAFALISTSIIIIGCMG